MGLGGIVWVVVFELAGLRVDRSAFAVNWIFGGGDPGVRCRGGQEGGDVACIP